MTRVSRVRRGRGYGASGTPGDVLTKELIARVYDVACVVTAHPVTGTPVITFTPRGAI